MLSDIAKNKVDYSILALISGCFVVYFLTQKLNPNNLLIGSVIYAFSYLLWGVWHHLRSKTLSLRIVLEYFLVSTLAVIIVATLLL